MKHNSKKQTTPLEDMSSILIDNMRQVEMELAEGNAFCISSLLNLSNTAYQLARYCSNLLRRVEENSKVE